MDVWMYDHTSGGSWQDMAVVASGNQTVRVRFPISGHFYEVRVVDPAALPSKPIYQTLT